MRLLAWPVLLVLLVACLAGALPASAAPADPAPPRAPAADRSAAWQRAVADAERRDVRDVLEPRPIAAVGGLAWFALALRARRRRARRAAAR